MGYYETLQNGGFMTKLICFLALLCWSAMSFAERFNPYQGPQPVAILIQTDPWLMVIGSDTPRLAIYDDGEVIYLHVDKSQRSTYVYKQLTGDELEAIKKKLSSFGDYMSIREQYDLMPNVSDLPETKIYLNLNGKVMATSIYGLTLETKASAIVPGADVLPAVLQNLYRYLVALKFPDTKPWLPKYVEVMVWRYSYAPDQSIHWPKDWPDLDSAQTIKRGDTYSIFMPATEIPRLSAFLKTRREKGAVEIDGKKWAVAFRYTFPNEPVWFGAFSSI